MTKLDYYFTQRKDIGITILRLFIGGRLAYGAVDNVVSWPRMIEFADFLRPFGFPFPVASAVISAYAQFICGLLLLIGYKLRYAAAAMVVNFIIAVLFVHVSRGDSVEQTTPALALLFGSLTLLFTGAGRWAIDKEATIQSTKPSNIPIL